MVYFSYPPTRKQLMLTMGLFITGASFFATGAYYSMVNIAPQQARVKARSDYIRARIRQWVDDS